jgi:hypothetical protein
MYENENSFIVKSGSMGDDVIDKFMVLFVMFHTINFVLLNSLFLLY